MTIFLHGGNLPVADQAAVVYLGPLIPRAFPVMYL